MKSLVTMHGGSLRASSEGTGRGSTFTVELPLSVQLQPEPSEKRAQTAHLDVEQARTILIADDNIDSAQSLAMLLRLQGHDVATVFDGMEAIEKVSTINPDVVILDLGMPRMNGLEAARRIRQLPEGDTIKLIALTGWGQEGDRQRTLEHGFDHHLVKPLTLQELDAIIGTLASTATAMTSRRAIVLPGRPESAGFAATLPTDMDVLQRSLSTQGQPWLCNDDKYDVRNDRRHEGPVSKPD